MSTVSTLAADAFCLGKLSAIERDPHTGKLLGEHGEADIHSPVGFKHTHTPSHTHTLGSSQAAEALRYAVDRDYQHSSLAAFLPSACDRVYFGLGPGP